MLPTSRLRANSEESGGDGSSKCKEAGGAQDTISHNPDDNEEEEDDDEDDGLEDVDEEDDAELILLRRAMDALEHRMFSEGTVASVFARTIAQAQLAEKTLGADALEAMEDIFHGDAEADPGAVAAALEPNAARARVYLIVMNDNVGFTLLHHLQRMDQEIRPGDPIANKIVAFKATFDRRDPPLMLSYSTRRRTPCSSGSTCLRPASRKPTTGTARRPTGTTKTTRSWLTRRSR